MSPEALSKFLPDTDPRGSCPGPRSTLGVGGGTCVCPGDGPGEGGSEARAKRWALPGAVGKGSESLGETLDAPRRAPREC